MRQRRFPSRSWMALVGAIAALFTFYACDSNNVDSSAKFIEKNDQYSHGLGVSFVVNQIYWTDHFKQGFAPSGQIERADLDGKNETVLIKGLKEPEGLALDLVFRKIYWTDRSTGLIQRADLSGSNVETLVPSLQGGPAGLVVDFPRARMYWTETSAGVIKRADYRSGQGTEVVLGNLGEPNSIALALDTKSYMDARRMFWTERSSGKIKRADLDGKNVQELLVNRKGPEGLALNLTAGKMYWAEGSEIHEANLDGTNNKVLNGLQVQEPHGIAVDVASSHMYFTLIKGAIIANDDPDPAKARLISNIQGAPAGIALGIK